MFLLTVSDPVRLHIIHGEIYMLEAVAQRCSVKKVFLKISQNSQENICARVPHLFIKSTSGGYFCTCPSCIIDSMVKDRRFFVLTILFWYPTLSKLSYNLIIPAVAFPTEAWQFWDILSALFIQTCMSLLQNISLFNLGVHISPQFCRISNFSCNFLLLPIFFGSYDQCILITDASLSEIGSPKF